MGVALSLGSQVLGCAFHTVTLLPAPCGATSPLGNSEGPRELPKITQTVQLLPTQVGVHKRRVWEVLTPIHIPKNRKQGLSLGFGLRPQGPCGVGTGESGLVLSEEGNPAGLSSCSA